MAHARGSCARRPARRPSTAHRRLSSRWRRTRSTRWSRPPSPARSTDCRSSRTRWARRWAGGAPNGARQNSSKRGAVRVRARRPRPRRPPARCLRGLAGGPPPPPAGPHDGRADRGRRSPPPWTPAGTPPSAPGVPPSPLVMCRTNSPKRCAATRPGRRREPYAQANFDSAQSASMRLSKWLCGSTTRRTVLCPVRSTWTGIAWSPPLIRPDLHSWTPSAWTEK